ncbi:MAG: tetratricopeptide repeat protein [Burkholderiales bacterium]|jgi:predicted negative regulator of RcsB-dependent stress response|nr:tetratricopeptide repeat protein [Burkholderiales bacterium]
MAVYDIEEQENIDALKAWWKQYGKLAVAAVIAFVVGIAGVQGWRWHKQQQEIDAAQVFAQFEEAARLGDKAKVAAQVALLEKDHARTAFAPRAAMVAAKLAVDAGDLATAERELRWAVEHTRDIDAPLRALANLHLAAVLLDQKKYDDALKAVSAPPTEAFAALYADARGDVLVAQGRMDDAKTAYQAALDKLPKASPWRNVVEVKRDALGGR